MHLPRVNSTTTVRRWKRKGHMVIPWTLENATKGPVIGNRTMMVS